jgi:LEA14-like dessication related protein
MKILRSCSLVVFALLSLGLAGCGGSNIQQGGITVVPIDLKPVNATLLESEAILTLRITNENIGPLGFSGSSHRLYLNGSYVGNSVNDRPFGVPPLRSITQDVTIHFENLALVRQLASVGESRTASYRLETVLHQTIYEDKTQLKVHAEGSLDLSALAKVAR